MRTTITEIVFTLYRCYSAYIFIYLLIKRSLSLCFLFLWTLLYVFFFFFFQAEDGIRDYKVTGVQTCALPILISHENILEFLSRVPEERQHRVRFEELVTEPRAVMEEVSEFLGIEPSEGMQIGRASCRERV